MQRGVTSWMPLCGRVQVRGEGRNAIDKATFQDVYGSLTYVVVGVNGEKVRCWGEVWVRCPSTA